MNLQRSGLNVLFSNAFITLISFIGVVYFARELHAVGLGTFFLYKSALGIISIITSFGIDIAVERKISKGDKLGFAASGLLLKLITTTIITILLAGIAYLFPNTSLPIWYLIISNVIFQSYLTLKHILRGQFQVTTAARLESLQKLIWLLTGITAVFFGGSAKSLIISDIIGYGIVVGLSAYLIKLPPVLPSYNRILDLLSFSKYVAISSIVSQVFSWADVLIIGIFLSEMHAGQYQAAWQISMLVSVILFSISETVFPEISSYSIKNHKRDIENLLEESIIFGLIISIPAVAGSALYSKEILTYIYSTEYQEAYLAFIIIMLQRPFQAVNLVSTTVLQATGGQRFTAYVGTFASASNVLLNLFLIRKFGITGVALGTLISYIIATSGHVYFLPISIEIDLEEVYWILFSTVTMSFLLLTIPEKMLYPQIFGPLPSILVGAVFYISLILSKKEFRNKATRFKEGLDIDKRES